MGVPHLPGENCARHIGFVHTLLNHDDRAVFRRIHTGWQNFAEPPIRLITDDIGLNSFDAVRIITIPKEGTSGKIVVIFCDGDVVRRYSLS